MELPGGVDVGGADLGGTQKVMPHGARRRRARVGWGGRDDAWGVATMQRTGEGYDGGAQTTHALSFLLYIYVHVLSLFIITSEGIQGNTSNISCKQKRMKNKQKSCDKAL